MKDAVSKQIKALRRQFKQDLLRRQAVALEKIAGHLGDMLNQQVKCDGCGKVYKRLDSEVKKSKDFSLTPYQCLKCGYQWNWRCGNTCPQEHCRSTKISKRLDGGEERP